MPPAKVSQLEWLAPEHLAPAAFAARRPRLDALVRTGGWPEVYAAKRRRILRAEDPVLGAVGIKEISNSGWLRRLWFRHFAEHRALREFRVGAAFAARGGRTPGFLGAALDRNAVGLARVLLVLPWIDDAETLTAHLKRRPADDATFDALAASLVDAARLGLVHGRHSSENILVVPKDGGVEFQVIDFAYARLGDRFDAPGFSGDVVRIALYLVLTEACSRKRAEEFLVRAAAVAWQDADGAARWRERMDRDLARRLAEHGESNARGRG